MNENMEISELKILEIMLSRNKEEIDRYEKLENIRKYSLIYKNSHFFEERN